LVDKIYSRQNIKAGEIFMSDLKIEKISENTRRK